MSEIREIIDSFKANLPAEMGRAGQDAMNRLAASATSHYMRDVGFPSGPVGRNTRTGPGSLRIISGRLARSLINAQKALSGGSVREGIADMRITSEGVSFRWGTTVPYAGVHERGFQGTVQVPAHQRTISQAFGRPIDPKSVSVRPHSRDVNIQARPYMGPAVNDEVSNVENIILEGYERALIGALS